MYSIYALPPLALSGQHASLGDGHVDGGVHHQPAIFPDDTPSNEQCLGILRANSNNFEEQPLELVRCLRSFCPNCDKCYINVAGYGLYNHTTAVQCLDYQIWIIKIAAVIPYIGSSGVYISHLQSIVGLSEAAGGGGACEELTKQQTLTYCFNLCTIASVTSLFPLRSIRLMLLRKG